MTEKLKNLIFITKIDDDNYIAYNSKRHLPIKLDKIGHSYLQHIIDEKNHCNASIDDFDDYQDFKDALDNCNFFNTTEIQIDASFFHEKMEKYKKHFYLHLTDRCNLNCRYCYNADKRISLKDMSLNEWKKILDKILPYSLKFTLTGGEVLLHKDFDKIVKYIKDYDSSIVLSLISNGSHDIQRLNIINSLKLLDYVQFSADNIDDDNHERIGFNKEVFLKNIYFFKNFKLKNPLVISSVWSNKNFNYVDNVRKFCKENDIGHTISLRIPNSKQESVFMPTYKDHEDFFLKKDIILSTTEEEVNYGKEIVNSCNAATTVFSVDAQGDCYPCQSFHFKEFKLGSLLSQEFENIFYSPVAEMLRFANNVNNKDICKDCNMKYLCGGGCIANTFGIEGRLLAHPATMCKYYKNGVIRKLTHMAF